MRVQELAEASCLLVGESPPLEEEMELLLLRWKMREQLELELMEQLKWLVWLWEAKAAGR